MSTARGISNHEIVETMEACRLKLSPIGVSNLQADRIGVVLLMMLANPCCTAREACAAADRLFPMDATQPALELKSLASDETTFNPERT